MLAAEALRLSAIEILSPTAVQESGPYPTLAGYRVYDSRAVALEDLDQDGPYTPVLSLYTPESGVKLRGPHAAADDTEAEAVLEIVAELAVSATDNGVTYADALASADPEARLVLAALCAQVRRLLERSQAGGLWRRLVRQITDTDYKTFAVPELGLRWHRVTIRMHCEIRDDDFDMTAGGLPEPIKSLYEALPDDSYAKEKLGVLAAHFDPELLPQLQQVRITTGPVTSGSDDLSP
ncbi:hypothetical protein [Rhizobium sp. BK602]|uniref:hypothetical protein n=1 Tax=Rhizobium sp. BK602 TaxID=2586986 RepID=UPI001616E40B|nr:hypothetical protein [Rhizobium sp. BK602]MBB3608666.1 hypothetical protein [Rhizobium sp. BK602]